MIAVVVTDTMNVTMHAIAVVVPVDNVSDPD